MVKESLCLHRKLSVLAPQLKTLAFHFQVTSLYTGEDSRKPQNSQNVKNIAVSRGEECLGFQQGNKQEGKSSCASQTGAS